ncbi:hypothetical protein HY571_01350 [Candidatus Micrarchaeota archaeon]|nr:hypothetical protein [Candidatus Micrarchaeota archaeon]
MGLFSWLLEEENKFFALHAAAVLILAIIVELFIPQWTTFTLPAVLLLGLISFMLNYPVKAIKDHGLFAEYLIELRLLWLVILGVLSEYVVFQAVEAGTINLFGILALVAGILVLFYSHSHLHSKIVKARGFN